MVTTVGSDAPGSASFRARAAADPTTTAEATTHRKPAAPNEPWAASVNTKSHPNRPWQAFVNALATRAQSQSQSTEY
jgi:hypothetical protein